MPKEEQEKKKPGIVKRIFKWFGLGVLSSLIILGLIFEAPWKVITLLLIVLAACRILPKPAIKWFWLSVGAVVIALIIWVFLPDGNGDWRPYTFDKELAAIEAAHAIPDSENAATIYNKLLKDYDPNAMRADFLVGELEYLTRSEPWSSKDYPEIAQWLKNQESTIATLIEASKIKKCRFPIVANSMALGQHMKILAPMRQWVYLLIRAASNDLGEGRIDQAIEKNLAVLQMAKHQFQQPTMVDLLVGIAVEALAIRQFNRFVVAGDATEEHLSIIEKALEEIKHDWSYDLPRILEGEKLIMKNFLGMFYEVNSKGKIRLIRDPTGLMRASLPEEMPPLTYWQRKLFKIATIWCWFFLPSTPQKAGKIIDESYEKYYAMAEPDYDWGKEPKELPITSAKFNFRFLTEMLVSIMEPAYHRIDDIYLRVTTDKRGCQIIIALRRYKDKTGHWPENLDDVKSFVPQEIFVDPINNNSFVYKLTEENFTLYSKGKNNIDEGGEYESTWDPNTRTQKVEKDDRLIWPPRRGCETEEEGVDDE